MSNVNPTELKKEVTGLDIYAASVSEAGGATYFLGRRDLEKMVGCVGEGTIHGKKVGEVTVGPTVHENAAALRNALPWTAPKCWDCT